MKKIVTAFFALFTILAITLTLSSCLNGGKYYTSEEIDALLSKHEHTFGEWIDYTGNANVDCENRLYYHICTECNAIEWKSGSYEDHDFETEYSYDKSFHWFACKNCEAPSAKSEHNIDASGYCTVCNVHMPTEGVLYKLSADKTYAEVIGYSGTATQIIIADEYEGVPVTTIYKETFYNNDNITSVTIPDSVTSIGNEAFCDCTSLTSVTIPDSVTSIGNSVFWCCTSLTSVTIPDSVTSIGDYAFQSCPSLTSITVDENNNYYKSIDGNLYTKDGKALIQYAIGKTNTDFTIPNSVTSIGDCAFSACSSLTSITIPDGVTGIGSYAFEYCTSLTNVTIPDSVTSIGRGAFSDCTSLTSVTIGDSVTSIGDYAFCNCSSLTNITVDENNNYYKSIDGNLYTKDGKALIQYAIGKTNTDFTIQNSVTSIGYEAFRYCFSLTSVTIPDSVKSIGNYAFSGCSSLTSVTIGNSVTSIGYYAFDGCTSLTSIKYRGTEAEWNAISKGSGWNSSTGKYTIEFNYTGE